MARYFFHTQDGRCYPDDRGLELPDMGAARDKAIRVLTEMLPAMAADFWEERALSIVVTDDTDLTLFTLDITASDSPAVTPAAAARRTATPRDAD